MSGKRVVLVLAIAVTLVAVYRWRCTARTAHVSADDAYATIAALTPDSVLHNCGATIRDTTGKLVDGDGIRDLVYRSRSGRTIALRFLRDDRQSGWSGIGAWALADVDDDDLGTPLDDVEALRALPCLTQISSSAAHAAPSYTRAAYPQAAPPPRVEVVPRLRAPITPPAPAPGVTPGLTPLPGLPTLPDLPGSPGVEPTPAPLPAMPGGFVDEPSSTAGWDVTPEPPEPPDPPPPPSPDHPRFVVVPCVLGDAMCEVIDATLFLRDLDEARRTLAAFPVEPGLADRNWLTTLDDLVTRHTGRDFRLIQLPERLVDRRAVIQEIVRLEVESINVVVARLKDDLARVQPFPHDSAHATAKKLEVVRAAELERRALWRRAIDDSRPERSMTYSDDGNRFQMNDSPAFRQLQRIAIGGWSGF